MKLRSRTFALPLVGVLLFAALGATGCADKDVIAKVNGSPIKLSDVDAQLAQMKKSSPQTFQGTDGKKRETEFKAKIVESLIQLELIKQAGKELGVSITAKQIDDYIKQLETQYGGASGLTDAMKQSGVTMDQLRSSIESRLLVDAVGKKATKAGSITDAEMKDYFAKNPGMFKTAAQVHAWHILFATKDKAQAEKVYDQVKKGGDFAALAKQYSTDPGSRDKGGDLGWAPSTQYVTEFAAAVSSMKVGEFRLVETQFGWHIIKLVETKPAEDKTFDQVKDQIKQIIQQQNQSDDFTKYVDELKKKAKIEILDAEIKKLIDAAAQPATSTVPAQ
ncbi:MAG: peptidylprolyl isomerase [Coriobacteriia bacterium]|nr:peptidylprolyl isomerase [Coriobacteriia bacterium]